MTHTTTEIAAMIEPVALGFETVSAGMRNTRGCAREAQLHLLAMTAPAACPMC